MNSKIAILRRNAGYSTQEQLANHLDIPRPVIAKFEAGITTPRIATLARIAIALGCKIEDLLDIEVDANDMSVNQSHTNK